MITKPYIKIILRILFLLVFISAGEIYSQELYQTVRGRISEYITKQPVSGASVKLFSDVYRNGAESTTDGFFVFEKVPPGRYRVTVEMIGYYPFAVENVIVTTGKETFVNAELRGSEISTDEIVVTDEIEKEKSSNPFSVISGRSFSIDETKRFAGTFDDPMRAVQNFAGVVSSPNVNTNGIVVRGNSPKGLLWRLEDVDIPNPNHFSFAGRNSGGLTVFSGQLLSNSDFYTSAFPPEYGNAFSGAFDMRFRNGNCFKREYTAQLGIQGIEFAAEGPFSTEGKSSFLFNYRYSVFGFLQLFDKDMKNKVPSYQDLSFKINIPTVNTGTFSLFGIGGLDKSKYDPDADSSKWEKLDDRTKSSLGNTMGAVGISHAIPLGRNALLKTTLSARTQQIDYERGFVNSDYSVSPTDKVNYKTSGLGVYSYIHHKFSGAHINKTGIRYTEMFFDADISSENQFTGGYEHITDDKGRTGLLQAFTQSSINIGSRFTFAGGLNVNYFALNKSTTAEPRLSLKYALNSSSSLSAGFGMHSQYEDICVYLSSVRDSTGTSRNPNRDLKPSRALHFVLGYDLMISKDIHLKAEGYYQRLYDVPVMKDSYYSMLNNPGGYFNDPLVNSGSGRNAGLDITLEKFFSGNYYYIFTASVYDSKYKGGDGIERNGKYNSNFAFNLLGGKEFLTKSGNVWSVNLKASYTGGEYYIPVDLDNSVREKREILDYSRIYTEKLEPFLYLDATFSYRINYKRTSLVITAQAKNILDKKVVLGYSYNNYSKSINEQTELGLVPMLSVKYEF